jgi:hypothetical protein
MTPSHSVPSVPDDEQPKRRVAQAHEVLDSEGGPVRNDVTQAGTTKSQEPGTQAVAVVDVIRRLRRGRWTLTEVYR